MTALGLGLSLPFLVARNGGGGYPRLFSKFVAFGDSNTAGSGGGGKADAYPEQMAVRGRGRFKMLKNSGVAGERSDQIVARIDADMATYEPAVVFLMMGTNNIEQGTPQATFEANVATAVEKVVAGGGVPVFLNLFPNDNNPSTTLAYNAFLASWCPANRVRLIDAHTPLSNGSGGWNATYKADALHSNYLGDILVADTILAALTNTWDEWPSPLSDTASALNLFGNGLSITDTDANGTPDGWTVLGTGVVCETIDDLERGRGIKLTLSSGSNAGISTGNPSANFSVGDVLLPLFDVRVSNGITLNLGCRFTGPNTNLLVMSSWGAAGDGVIHGKVTVPSGSTNVSHRLFGSGTGTIEMFGRNTLLRNLTLEPLADY